MTNYLINLAEDRERLARQEEQFGRIGLPFERVEACRDDDGARDRLRWWCAVLRPAVKGEIGCALSHLSVWRRMQERGEDSAAVFEDDVRLSPETGAALSCAEAACRGNPRLVVLLGDHRRTKEGEPLARAGAAFEIVPETWNQCSEGYVIGKAAAATLLRVLRRIRVPVDSWGYYRRKGWIDLMRIEPSACGQDVGAFASGLGERYVIDGKDALERLWWKARRAVGRALDAVLDGGRLG